MQVIRNTTLLASVIDGLATAENPSAVKVATETAISEDRKYVAQVKRYLSHKARWNKSHAINASYQLNTEDAPEFILEYTQIWEVLQM